MYSYMCIVKAFLVMLHVRIVVAIVIAIAIALNRCCIDFSEFKMITNEFPRKANVIPFGFFCRSLIAQMAEKTKQTHAAKEKLLNDERKWQIAFSQEQNVRIPFSLIKTKLCKSYVMRCSEYEMWYYLISVGAFSSHFLNYVVFRVIKIVICQNRNYYFID